MRPNLAEFQEKVHTKHGATGLPGIVSPNYPDDKFGRRVIFNTDKTTRRDIQNEIDATRDAVYAQLLANRESKKQSKEDHLRQEQDMLGQIKESLQMAQQKKRNLLYQERRHLDEANMANIRAKSQQRKKISEIERDLERGHQTVFPYNGADALVDR